LKRQSVEVDDRLGVAITLKVTIEGVDFTYRCLLIQNGNFYYQILGWTMSRHFPGVEADLVAVGESITFAEDRDPQIRASLGAEDDHGVDWIITDNVYSNVSFGFRLRPRGDFRLSERQELQQMGPDASAGIVGNYPTFYQVYVIEFAGEQNQEQFAENVLLWMEQEFDLLGVSSTTSTLTLAGVEAQQRIYENANLGGLAYDISQTYFFRDSYFFRIQSWWPSAEAEAARTRLLQSYELLEWLSDQERTELLAEFTEFDANNAVGFEYSLRHNVFRDFQYGFTMTIPPGLWEVETGDTAQLINPDARLIALLSSEGIQFLIIPELLRIDHSEYHEILRQSMDVPAEVVTEPLQHHDLELLVSAFDSMEGAFSISYRLVTAVRGRKHIQLLVWSQMANKNTLDEWLPKIIEGFEMPVSSPQIIERKGRVIKDHRLGFQMTYTDGWSHEVTPIPGLEALSNMIVLSTPEKECLALAVYVPLGGFDENLIIDAMMANMMFGIDPSTRREEASTLAGLPARQISFDSQEEDISFTVWIAVRGNTAYFLLIQGKTGELGSLDTYKEFFSLLD